MNNNQIIIALLLVVFLLVVPVIRIAIDGYFGTQVIGKFFGKGVHSVLLMLSGAVIFFLVWKGIGLIR